MRRGYRNWKTTVVEPLEGSPAIQGLLTTNPYLPLKIDWFKLLPPCS
jgi:hypothetical protein